MSTSAPVAPTAAKTSPSAPTSPWIAAYASGRSNAPAGRADSSAARCPGSSASSTPVSRSMPAKSRASSLVPSGVSRLTPHDSSPRPGRLRQAPASRSHSSARVASCSTNTGRVLGGTAAPGWACASTGAAAATRRPFRPMKNDAAASRSPCRTGPKGTVNTCGATTVNRGAAWARSRSSRSSSSARACRQRCVPTSRSTAGEVASSDNNQASRSRVAGSSAPASVVRAGAGAPVRRCVTCPYAASARPSASASVAPSAVRAKPHAAQSCRSNSSSAPTASATARRPLSRSLPAAIAEVGTGSVGPSPRANKREWAV